MTICTNTFLALGRVEAQRFGMPSLNIAAIPHPVGGLRPEEVQQRADNVFEEVISLLTKK